MSAIAAVFRCDGAPVPRPQITGLLSAMAEYGEEAGLWAPESPAAPVALGCLPWRVTPEDAWYRPPVRSRDDRFVLVADARIDNREALAAELGITAGEARESPDAAFILAAYEAWGLDAPRRLVGDFAFLLWDAPHRRLVCARDGVGQRVVFYRQDARQVAFATTPHALATLPGPSPRLNRLKVAEFLVLLPNHEGTFFEGIRRVSPGHLVTAGADGIQSTEYWSPMPARRLVLGSDGEYVEGFLEVFGQAVRSRLRSTRPVGIMASGGLDSSSVAAVAATELRQAGRRLPLFHAAPRLGFQGAARPGFVADESPHVEAMARLHPNIDLRIWRPDGRSPFDGIEATFRLTGAPPRNAGNVAWFTGIYEQAGGEGIRVMLAGHKGNATISYNGLRSLAELVRHGHWMHARREVRALARATASTPESVWRYQVLRPLLPTRVAAGLQQLRRQPPAPAWDLEVSAILPAFAKELGMAERVRAAHLDPLYVRRLGETEFRVAALRGGADVLDSYSGLRPGAGIETRDPTADRRVIEYCFAIPGSQYLRDGVSRWLIRRAMDGLVPDEIRARKAIGAQSSDWSEWLPGLRGPLAGELDLLEDSDTARTCLDLPRLRGLMDRWPTTLGVQHERAYFIMLLRGMMMGRYLRWFETTYSAT